MHISANAASAASAAVAKPHGHGNSDTLNPAKQAKAADPAVKGADFGALVSQFARAKHAPAPTAPAPTPDVPVTPPTDGAVDIVV
jgi:hypothetical protein